jgi:hypothetical protein
MDDRGAVKAYVLAVVGAVAKVFVQQWLDLTAQEQHQWMGEKKFAGLRQRRFEPDIKLRERAL